MTTSLCLSSKGVAPRLRIGVFTDSGSVLRHFANALKNIQDSEFARLELVIRSVAGGNGTNGDARSSFQSMLLGEAPSAWNSAFRKFLTQDADRFPEKWAAFSPVDSNCLFSEIPDLKFDTPDSVRRICSFDLDVILHVGSGQVPDELLNCARYGVWSLLLRDVDRYRGGPPLIWELLEENPVFGATLFAQYSGMEKGRVLTKAQFPTTLGSSFALTAVTAFSSSGELVIHKLRQLHESGWGSVLSDAPAKQPYAGQRRSYGCPSVVDMAKFAGRTVARKAVRVLKARTGQQPGERKWRLGIRRRTGALPWIGSWGNFNWISSDKAPQLADGFLFEREGRTWLFAEAFDSGKDGIIVCGEVKDDGSVTELSLALKEGFHLSFPYVFEHGDDVFMIPESEEANSIRLYRAVEFPSKWEFVHTLHNEGAVDTVVHQGADGTFYFFTSMRSEKNAHPSLFLFYADGLFGEWKLHPASPISLDARYSRNANALFEQDGVLYRIAQDPTYNYGRQMHFFEITRLSRTEYAEELVGTRPVAAEWGPGVAGTHSYSLTGKWELVDVLGDPGAQPVAEPLPTPKPPKASAAAAGSGGE